jgi:hypothetical protein
MMFVSAARTRASLGTLAAFGLLLSLSTFGGCSSDSSKVSDSRDDGGSSGSPGEPGDSGQDANGEDGAATNMGDAGDGGDASRTTCNTARDQLIGPIDSVSAGAVSVESSTVSSTVLYIDASAGGFSSASTNPRIYVSLKNKQRVDVTDRTSLASTAWDLSIKRSSIYTNDGDGGPGAGGAFAITDKTFDAVTISDVTAMTDAGAHTFAKETFFDADCNAQQDAIGGPLTTFDGWYNYEGATMHVTPKAWVYVVRGATSEYYKLQILDFYATSDGGTGTASGFFSIRFASL